MSIKPPISIRRSLERADWQFIREVCCLTANSGEPIATERWPFFGEWWVAPYEKLRPEWSYIAEDGRGARLGYLTGCPDTSRFNREKWFFAELPLYLKLRLGFFAPTSDTARWITRFERKDRWPEECFNPEATRAVLKKYPAHLHMNLHSSARGAGTGRLLVERFAADLASEGVHGIHLYCGEKPLPFYLKAGFSEIDRIEFRPGVWVYRLGRVQA